MRLALASICKKDQRELYPLSLGSPAAEVTGARLLSCNTPGETLSPDPAESLQDMSLELPP